MMTMIYPIYPWLKNQQTKQQARQYDFDFDCAVDCFKLLVIYSEEPNPTDMDGILQHHKNYHLSSIVGAGPNFVLDRVMGEKLNASK